MDALIALAVSVMVATIDYSCLFYWYLADDLTTTILLKTICVAIAAILTISYLIVFLKNTVSILRCLLVVITLLFAAAPAITSLIIIPTSIELSAMRLDIEKIDSLSSLYSSISTYYQTSKSLPDNLEVFLSKNLISVKAGTILDRRGITYKRLDQNSFNLCGNFSYPTTEGAEYVGPYHSGKESLFLRRQQGECCFNFKLQANDKELVFKRVD